MYFIEGEVGSFDYKIAYRDFSSIKELFKVVDTNPIRAACFSPDGQNFVLGTNSKCLKIYHIANILNKNGGPGGLPTSPLIYEKKNHHQGSIYALDWSSSGKLIASCSNDKSIKIM